METSIPQAEEEGAEGGGRYLSRENHDKLNFSQLRSALCSPIVAFSPALMHPGKCHSRLSVPRESQRVPRSSNIDLGVTAV